MTQLNPILEWKRLKFEILENRPKETPYPPDVVEGRGLLLLAQSLLADYQYEKARRKKRFFGELYRSTMEFYDLWDTDRIDLQLAAGKRYFNTLHGQAIANGNERMTKFCKKILDVFKDHGFDRDGEVG